jgi:hypothetical protein
MDGAHNRFDIMKLKNCPLALLLAAMTPCLTLTLKASIVVTYSGPNANTSSLTGAKTFTFNNLPTGLNTNVSWSGVGTFNKLDIVNPNLYGGATDATATNGTRYSIQGLSDLTSSTTLTLSQNNAYFGIWLSAADASNVIAFYENGTLVGQFTTADMLTDLGPGYDGNPRNRTQNPTQPYVFLNFYGDSTTKWNTIVISGTSTSANLEADNYTVRVGTYNSYSDGSVLPGTPFERMDGSTATAESPSSTGAALWGSAEAVPGTPAPPLSLLVIFGLVLFLKSRMSRARSAQA